MLAQTLHLYELDDGEERHWMSHTNPADALRVAIEDWCIRDGLDDDDEVTVRQLPDDELFTIGCDDPWEVDPPEGAEVIDRGGRVPSWKATAAAWAKWAGEGVICASTVE